MQRATPTTSAATEQQQDTLEASAATTFYEHHGFQRLTSQPRTLLLPLATAAKALTAASIRRAR